MFGNRHHCRVGVANTGMQAASRFAWRRGFAVVAALLFCTFAAPRLAAAQSPGCKTGYFEVTPRAGVQMQVLPTRYRDMCEMDIDGIRVQVWVLKTTEPNRDLDFGKIEQGLKRATGARGNLDADWSLSNFFSNFVFLIAGRIPYYTYSAPGHRQGYMEAALSEQIGVFGRWIAPRDLQAEPLRGSVLLTIVHGGALSFWQILMMKGANVALLLLLIVPCLLGLFISDLRSWMNALMPVDTWIGKGLLFAVVPGALIGVAYLVVTKFGATLTPVLFAAGCLVNAIQMWVHAAKFAAAKQGRFAPYFNENPPSFQELTLHHTETEVEDVPVISSYFANYVLWRPYSRKCQRCDLAYVVHTASRAETSISHSEYEARKISLEKVQSLATDATAKSRPPMSGCPKCGTRAADAAEAQKLFRRATTAGPAFLKVVGGLVGFVAGMLLWHAYSEWDPHISYVGWAVDYVLEIVFGAIIFVPLGVFFVGLYGLAVYLSSRYLARGSTFFRIWVCQAEGLLFEDAELIASHDGCTNCKKPLEPLRAKLA